MADEPAGRHLLQHDDRGERVDGHRGRIDPLRKKRNHDDVQVPIAVEVAGHGDASPGHFRQAMIPEPEAAKVLQPLHTVPGTEVAVVECVAIGVKDVNLPVPVPIDQLDAAGAKGQVRGPPKRLAKELPVSPIEKRLHALVLVAHQREEIEPAVRVEVADGDVDRAAARVQLLRLEARLLAGPRHVPEHQNPPRVLEPELGNHDVELASGVHVDGPRVGHAPQSGRKNHLAELPGAGLLAQPHDPAAIVIERLETPEIRHEQVHEPVPVEVARLDVAGVIEPGQRPRSRPWIAQVQRRHQARQHVAGQQDGRIGGAEPRPAKPRDGRLRLARCPVHQGLPLEGNAELRVGLCRFGIDQVFGRPGAKVRKRLLHGRRIEIGPARPTVVLVALLDLRVPLIAMKTLGPGHGVAVAAERPDACFRGRVDLDLGLRVQQCGEGLVLWAQADQHHGD